MYGSCDVRVWPVDDSTEVCICSLDEEYVCRCGCVCVWVSG